MTVAEAVIASRSQIAQFVIEIETAYAKEYPEKSAKWLIDDIQQLGPDKGGLDEALQQVEYGHKFLPSPAVVASTVREELRRTVRYVQPSLGDGALDNAATPFLHARYPKENVTWDQHVARIHRALPLCQSKTCDVHRTPEELAEHETGLRKGQR